MDVTSLAALAFGQSRLCTHTGRQSRESGSKGSPSCLEAGTSLLSRPPHTMPTFDGARLTPIARQGRGTPSLTCCPGQLAACPRHPCPLTWRTAVPAAGEPSNAPHHSACYSSCWRCLWLKAGCLPTASLALWHTGLQPLLLFLGEVLGLARARQQWASKPVDRARAGWVWLL